MKETSAARLGLFLHCGTLEDLERLATIVKVPDPIQIVAAAREYREIFTCTDPEERMIYMRCIMALYPLFFLRHQV
jgi:hypothetical protein